jgi:hypothetical protein
VSGSEDSQAFGKKITPGTVGVVHAVAMFWSGLQILQVPGLVCKKQRVVVVLFGISNFVNYYKYTLLIYP